MRIHALLLTMVFAGIPSLMAGPLGPQDVVVLYNTAVPDSVKLAELYRDARHIPAANLIGLKMPVAADISRVDYNNTIRDPLRLEFEKRGFWERGRDASGLIVPVSGKIRVVVAMRGVPLRITQSPKPADFKGDPNNPLPGRDDAAVDSELALFGIEEVPAAGPQENKFYKSEKSITEANLPFMVLIARIDAATTSTCIRMIRDAGEVEATGLWGRAYVDIANKFPQGDQWLESIVAENLKVGIPTVVDRFNDTLPKNYPMSEAALYYGWYDWNVSGPFLNPGFKFRKGAVALHLHSFSAQQLTNPAANWSAPLLERGAAATVGNVFEPYLHLSHDFGILHQRLLAGYTLVEAAWMAMPAASWQGVVLGDPLYRPYAHFDGKAARLKADNEFLVLRDAALKSGADREARLNLMQTAAERLASGTIAEAIGLCHLAGGKPDQAVVWFRKAKNQFKSPADKLRQDLHIIAIDRASPTGKAQAIKALREAQSRYGSLPEASALAGWLDILDPPPPPPAGAPGKPRK